jgi:hypothetical protein
MCTISPCWKHRLELHNYQFRDLVLVFPLDARQIHVLTNQGVYGDLAYVENHSYPGIVGVKPSIVRGCLIKVALHFHTYMCLSDHPAALGFACESAKARDLIKRQDLASYKRPCYVTSCALETKHKTTLFIPRHTFQC